MSKLPTNCVLKVTVGPRDCKFLNSANVLGHPIGVVEQLALEFFDFICSVLPHYHDTMVVSTGQYLLALLAPFLHPYTLLPCHNSTFTVPIGAIAFLLNGDISTPLLSTMHQYLLCRTFFLH